ncbi:kynurenine formamidase-like isoform X2 [Styela clava]
MLQFDAEIDTQYDVAHWSLRETPIPTCVEILNTGSDNFRTAHGNLVQNVRYGDGPKQSMDIVRKPGVSDDAPIMVFVHGGYWILTGRDMYLHIAQPAVTRGWMGVIVGYDQAPDVTVTTIVNEIRDAYIFLSKRFPKCPNLTFIGHSAGGHLISMLLATDWESYCPTQYKDLVPITKSVPISGVMDLGPFVHISYNKDLQLTKKEIVDLSPALHIDKAVKNIKKFGTKIIAVVGENDPPKFCEQSRDYIEALKKSSVDAKYIEYPVLDHFEVMEKLDEPDYDLLKHIFDNEN